MRACLPLRGQHSLGTPECGEPAVSRFTEGVAFSTINAKQSSPGKQALVAPLRPIGRGAQCYDYSMLEDFDLLAGKVAELARLVQSLRTENQQLRSQLTAASSELDAMRGRVDEASRRLDLLMERLPTPPNSTGVPWNT
jgi:cell division protein ZapB